MTRCIVVAMVNTPEAKQVCRAASTLLYPAPDFGVKACGTYTREDFKQVLSQIAFDQEFANTGGKTVQLDRSEPVDVTSTARNPLAKSLLYHLRHLDADAIDTQFDGVRDRLFQVLRSRRLLPDCVDVAIDLHDGGSTARPTQTTSSLRILLSKKPSVLLRDAVYRRSQRSIHPRCGTDGRERLPALHGSRSLTHRRSTPVRVD